MKKKIDINDAEIRLLNSLDNIDMGDKVYECVQSMFQGALNVVTTNTEITINGLPAKEVLDSGQEWYDEIREEFFEHAYDKLIRWIAKNNDHVIDLIMSE